VISVAILVGSCGITSLHSSTVPRCAWTTTPPGTSVAAESSGSSVLLDLGLDSMRGSIGRLRYRRLPASAHLDAARRPGCPRPIPQSLHTAFHGLHLRAMRDTAWLGQTHGRMVAITAVCTDTRLGLCQLSRPGCSRVRRMIGAALLDEAIERGADNAHGIGSGAIATASACVAMAGGPLIICRRRVELPLTRLSISVSGSRCGRGNDRPSRRSGRMRVWPRSC